MATTKQIRGRTKSFQLTQLSVIPTPEGGVRISGYANTPNVDRYKEIVEVGAFSGTIDTYKQNPIMLLQHNVETPIGYFDDLAVKAEGLWVSGCIVPGTVASDETIRLVKAGVLRTFSIGFRELDGEYDMDEVYHITQLELYEISVVSIPANRQSIFTLDETGKLFKVSMLDDEAPDLRSASTDQLLVILKERGVASPAAKEPPGDPLEVRCVLPAWIKGTCAVCETADTDVRAFAAAAGDLEWAICVECSAPEEFIVKLTARLDTLEAKSTEHETRLDDVEPVALAAGNELLRQKRARNDEQAATLTSMETRIKALAEGLGVTQAA
jgi:HK97 family phage prohead protease